MFKQYRRKGWPCRSEARSRAATSGVRDKLTAGTPRELDLMGHVLLITGIALVAVLAAVVTGRTRRARERFVLPRRSEFSTLVFPPSTPAERRRGDGST